MARLLLAFAIRLLAPFSFIAFLLILTQLRSSEVAGEALTVLSAAMIAAILGRGGFDQLMLRNAPAFRAEGKGAAASILKTALLVSWPCTAAAAAVMAFVVERIGELASVPPAWELVCLSLALVTCQTVSSAAQSSGRPLLSVLAFPFLGYAISLAALLHDVPATHSLLIGFGAVALPALTLASAHYRLHRAKAKLRSLAGSRYYLLINMNSLVFDWGINLVAAQALGLAQVPIIAFCHRVAGTLSLPLTAIIPYLMAEYATHPPRRGAPELKTVTRNVILLSAAAQLPLLAGLFWFHRQIASLGEVGAAQFLAITGPLAIAHVFNIVGGPCGAILLMRGGTRPVALVVCTTSFLTLLASALASAQFGLPGLASALAAGIIVQNLWYNWLLFRQEGFVPITLLWKADRDASIAGDSPRRQPSSKS